MKYILVDSLNMFMRAKHVGGRGNDIDMKIGMAMHTKQHKKSVQRLKVTLVVFCLEGRSWRKDFYPSYKANRKVQWIKELSREQEDDELYFEAYDDFIGFVKEKLTTVLRHPKQKQMI